MTFQLSLLGGEVEGRGRVPETSRQKFICGFPTDPPAGLTHALALLWWDAKGDWTKAHESAQRDEGPHGSWVHAYLHRKEGDQGNAAYWYSQAGKPVCREAHDAEWLGIVNDLLG